MFQGVGRAHPKGPEAVVRGGSKMLGTASKFFGWALAEWRAESRHN